jgi:GT2 family glycosyltransferase
VTAAAVSLIIVSRGRPDSLRRTLLSLCFQTHRAFEVITVGDTAPHVAFPDVHGVAAITHIPFDEANISAARNLGIAAAAGEIVAFCDDDAIPEPTWLAALTAPFTDPEIGAAGGFVRGRNGISYQWRGRKVDAFGHHEDISFDDDASRVFGPNEGVFAKTEGTNSAFRVSALQAVGGFDAALRYFLDETDLDLRLSDAGWKTALVPLAEVQHGFAASALRRADRAPTSLFEIGASKAVFGRRHLPETDRATALAGFRAMQRRRLIDFMVRGLIEPRDVAHLMATLENGFADGATRAFSTGLPPSESRPFSPFPAQGTLPGAAIACRSLSSGRATRQAEELARQGIPTTVFRLSLTSGFHRSRFTDRGFWLQTGGLFGRASRNEPIFRFTTLRRRVRAEIRRLQAVRPLSVYASDRNND